MAVVAPMPSARQATAEAVKPGFLARRRTAYRTSWVKADMALRRGGGRIVSGRRYSALPATMMAMGRSPAFTFRTVSCSPPLLQAGNEAAVGAFLREAKDAEQCALPDGEHDGLVGGFGGGGDRFAEPDFAPWTGRAGDAVTRGLDFRGVRRGKSRWGSGDRLQLVILSER